MYRPIEIGARIKYFRNMHGWSQEKLALQAGINPAFLGHLERGLKSPTITTLEKITAALDITLGELFSQNMEPEDSQQKAQQRLQFLTQDVDAETLQKINDIIQVILEIKS